MRQFFRATPRKILQRSIVLYNPGENLEIADPAGEWVIGGLEDVDGCGFRIGNSPLRCIPVSGRVRSRLDRLVFRGCRTELQNKIQQAIGSDVAQSGIDQNGKELAFSNRIVQGGDQVPFRDGSLIEEFLQQLVLSFRSEERRVGK